MLKQFNKEWHQKHPMPKNAKMEERINWHVLHAKHCACRATPEKVKEELIKRNE